MSILKGPSSSFVAKYRPISITSLLSNVIEVAFRFVSDRNGTQWRTSNQSVAHRKGLGTCNTLLFVFHTLQTIVYWRVYSRHTVYWRVCSRHTVYWRVYSRLGLCRLTS